MSKQFENCPHCGVDLKEYTPVPFLHGGGWDCGKCNTGFCAPGPSQEDIKEHHGDGLILDVWSVGFCPSGGVYLCSKRCERTLWATPDWEDCGVIVFSVCVPGGMTLEESGGPAIESDLGGVAWSGNAKLDVAVWRRHVELALKALIEAGVLVVDPSCEALEAELVARDLEIGVTGIETSREGSYYRVDFEVTADEARALAYVFELIQLEPAELAVLLARAGK